jgi:hypothetical protein
MVDAKYHTRTMRENRKQDDFMCFELARMLDLPVRSIPWFWKVVISSVTEMVCSLPRPKQLA